jgi:predicted ATPase/class 3 adenylate cyclase
MVAQPTGTVTLLFTDIDGSTRLLERLGPERYGEALDLHRRVLRGAFRQHAGYEVDCEGDSFFIAFAEAVDAVAAAAEGQTALAQAEWPDGDEIRVRMGVHTGEPLAVPPKYVGIDVHRAARIMASGHGGQVLVSAATRRLLGEVDVVALGDHRLKDLLHPEPLYQLVVAGLPSSFPALKTLGNRPTNLPVQPNALIGRELEIEEISALLRNGGTRLVTLTGPGGTGKTRLALQVGAELLDDFPSGVFFVSLAPIRDPSLLLPTIAQALAVREVRGEPLFQTLSSYLESKQILLVLDNFEQVVDAAGEVSTLLGRCGMMKLLVTSRERLRVSSEAVFQVPPLRLMAADGAFELLRTNEAVALFAARAQAASGSFVLDVANASAVAAICARLDGLPLAIELAAARTPMLPPEALLMRLDSRLPLLAGGARDADQRQRTLRDTIQWSYDLLEADERKLFARLSVFADGCRLDSAKSVCDPDGRAGVEFLEGIASLVDKSLVRQRSDDDGEPRLWMLETIREYAHDCLEELGDAEATRARHACHFVRYARTNRRGVEKNLQRLGGEHDNFRAACAWLREQDDVQGQLILATSLEELWEVKGPVQEGISWLEELTNRTVTVAPALSACEVGEQFEDLLSRAWHVLGLLLWRHGDLRPARAAFERSRSIDISTGDQNGAAVGSLSLAVLEYYEGNYDVAQPLVEKALVFFRAAGDERNAAGCLLNLGVIALLLGDPERARPLLEQALTQTRGLSVSFEVGGCLQNLGIAAVMQHRFKEAGTRLTESLSIATALGSKGLAAELIVATAALAVKRDSCQHGAMLLGGAEALAQSAGTSMGPLERQLANDVIETAREKLGETGAAAAIAQGRALSRDDALATAQAVLDDAIQLGG